MLMGVVENESSLRETRGVDIFYIPMKMLTMIMLVLVLMNMMMIMLKQPPQAPLYISLCGLPDPSPLPSSPQSLSALCHRKPI
jgi:hypothetical protein